MAFNSSYIRVEIFFRDFLPANPVTIKVEPIPYIVELAASLVSGDAFDFFYKPAAKNFKMPL